MLVKTPLLNRKIFKVNSINNQKMKGGEKTAQQNLKREFFI